ncbi:glutamate-5-semialdehyde dehydrogenase [Succinispira mobilis]|uniref:glutamate-5-semialdehyde dehydrogenase n=1 Tax=Succinispira mobilis TaxID=78120 RepID=UPI00037FA51A|nr:glutamate-5-semialdehyde dehydrogenase [Succinispira mobilis]
MLEQIKQQAKKARNVANILANMSTLQKNELLGAMADKLELEIEYILQANARDLIQAAEKGVSVAMQDRLRLTSDRIRDMATGIRQVMKLPDPIGEVISGKTLPNGLQINKVRVPLGVLGIIYESRPNVTIDAIALCLKSGNLPVLRGGSEAINSNTALVEIMQNCLITKGLPKELITFIAYTDRQAVNYLLKLNEYIDVIIPRGGAGLIKTVIENSTIPVIETGVGVCHVFVDSSADLVMAENIVINAKVSRPAVCNSMETLLVHKNIAKNFLPVIVAKLQQQNVKVQVCEQGLIEVPGTKLADDACFATENLDLIISIKIVENLAEAIEHIERFGTKHSEAIVTNDYQNAQEFQKRVDAAVVYVNASTRFTDGFEFGLGAEIGISTQKLHARGPMGLSELTSIKYIVNGNGQIR